MPKTRIMAFTWSTLKNLFSKPATKNYPAEPIRYPERSRGHIEIDIEDCISCSMCARSCPTRSQGADLGDQPVRLSCMRLLCDQVPEEVPAPRSRVSDTGG